MRKFSVRWWSDPNLPLWRSGQSLVEYNFLHDLYENAARDAFMSDISFHLGLKLPPPARIQ